MIYGVSRVQEANLGTCLFLNLGYSSILSLETSGMINLRVLCLNSTGFKIIDVEGLLNLAILYLSYTEI